MTFLGPTLVMQLLACIPVLLRMKGENPINIAEFRFRYGCLLCMCIMLQYSIKRQVPVSQLYF